MWGSVAEWLARRPRDLEVASSIPDHVMLQLPRESNSLQLSRVYPSVKWVTSYRQFLNLRYAPATPCLWVKVAFRLMYWSTGALVALLCGDTVMLSNEAKMSLKGLI
ncbi:hypothetical protein ElyMa_003291900 [Elysia marginata]|uniref:Uncharacterized protein n=1 Tax=Elysia marginata TaxID=1093978 RepID=A0AAV4JFZ3_9GAST|nr:hypothetical protein ElyMa_003291900 [Elysia marginata]